MDFITHSLLGVGAMRLLVPRGGTRAPLALAALLGSMLMDGDSWLYLIGPEYYGRYHRVASHSILGLALCAVLAALIAWGITAVRPWRRFGWFVHENLAEPPPHPPFTSYLAITAIAAALHFFADMITGFGNVMPYWPWSWRDTSLRLVNSFDVFIFATTIGWHLTIRQLQWPRCRERWVTAVYALVVLIYLVLRWSLSERTSW